MSLLGKLFGGRTLESERARADALFANGEFGAAKLAYEKAEDLSKGDGDARTYVIARKDECRDALARGRIEQAEMLLGLGDVTLAVEDLRGAIDTAASPAIVHEAEDKLARIERAAAQQQLEGALPGAEDRFELLAGSFEDDQYAEYKALGVRVEEAIVLMHDGEIAAARVILEDELPKADGPRYLWFELGRARLADGAAEAGSLALRTFLGKLHAEEGGDARLIAHMELGQVAQELGDADAAVQQYEAALEAMPNDPRPYLALSMFLRKQGTPEEAIEVVQAGLDALDESQSPWRLWQELGLAHADAGQDERAVSWLERVIDFLVGRQHVEPAPEGAVRLAQLYEQQGKPARALDLYSILARGSDLPNLCSYHSEAARLMTDLGLAREARRMLQRASELAGGDAELKSSIEARLAALAESPS